MSTMNQITKITLAWEFYEQEVQKIHIAQKLEIHRETIHLNQYLFQFLGCGISPLGGSLFPLIFHPTFIPARINIVLIYLKL